MFLSASEDMDKNDVTIAPLVLVKCQTHLKDGEKKIKTKKILHGTNHTHKKCHMMAYLQIVEAPMS